MIYIIDEDYEQLDSLGVEFQLRNYHVKFITNADDGFDILCQAHDVQAVIIDIMLATNDKQTSRYQRDQTNDFMCTGLSLVEDLVAFRPDLFPKKCVLYSMVSDPGIINTARVIAKKHGLLFVSKRTYKSVISVVDLIEAHIK